MNGKTTNSSHNAETEIPLEALLDHLSELCTQGAPDQNQTKDQDQSDLTHVSVGDIIHVVGDRSFAPLLMLVGMLLVSPLSGVPTFPSMVACVVLLVTSQMLYGRKHFWLPARLLNVQVPCEKLQKALCWLQRPAAFVDRITMPRMTVLVRGPSIYIIAVICLAIACVLPLMELILFSSSVAGAVLVLFGVALVTRDGLLALFGYSATVITIWMIVGGAAMMLPS